MIQPMTCFFDMLLQYKSLYHSIHIYCNNSHIVQSSTPSFTNFIVIPLTIGPRILSDTETLQYNLA